MRFRGIGLAPESMVVDNFDIVRSICAPHETDSPLAVDAHAMLSPAISAQRFQTITGNPGQIPKRYRIINHLKAPFCPSPKWLESGHPFAFVEGSRSLVAE
jgi:hypothetical protein